MTKKDIEALSYSIRCILNPDTWLQAAVAVSSACFSRFKSFDVDEFYIACGVANSKA
jgi:hypothetical protein